MKTEKLHDTISSDSFLEYAFLRWILDPVALPGLASRIEPQALVKCGEKEYRVDYHLRGNEKHFVIELDGFEFHSSRNSFSYDRVRQNDLLAQEKLVLRFSYDSIRRDPERCGMQVIAALRLDSYLSQFVHPSPVFEKPEMNPDPLYSLSPSPNLPMDQRTYFDSVREKLNLATLRQCQSEAFGALSSYYGSGGTNAACVMSVGAGKTALGVLAALAFTKVRALIVTPGNVIKGTFDQALDPNNSRNVLYALPGGPLIPGVVPPKVLTLDRDAGTIRSVTAEKLRAASIIVTNFHSIGTGMDEDDLLSKIKPEDIDLIVIDEAHIAASDSYQRLFNHFTKCRSLLMSACFQRLDGKPIDADVVYRYRLIDSIADGNAKNLRVQRFEPDSSETTYEIVWPDGAREELHGREALLELVKNEKKIAQITAKSTEPIRQVMRAVQQCLIQQRDLLHPVKPRVLFSALGERHAEQIALIAEDFGIPCAHLHHSMSESAIKGIRQRFESESGDLIGIVQLKMLGQGYDFPPISVVVPMRPYGSFSEFYQFIGRGIRVISHPALAGRVKPEDQYLDIVYHSEMGLDEHIETIYKENDMDPSTLHLMPSNWENQNQSTRDVPGSTGLNSAEKPEMFVLFERGTLEERVVHDQERVQLAKVERRKEALAQRYALYVQGKDSPVTFDQFQEILNALGE